MDPDCNVDSVAFKTLQDDITSVQTIGGYIYGFCYGFFLLSIFIAALCTEYRKSTIQSHVHTELPSSCSNGTVAIIPAKANVKPLKRMKNICKTMGRLKEIYFVIIVHMFDTLTDFLIMLEWYEKGRYELNTDNHCSFPNINYIGCFVCGCVIILFYRFLSVYYVYTYYQQSKLKAIVQSILQLFDGSVFYEVYQSHLHQSKTDNLSYLSKLEKTFESCPQLILQLYVLMRELSQGFPISEMTVISILFSLVSLATKVIHDDKTMFFKRANQKVKIYFYSRALFRVCEISSRLFAITLFATYFGANFLVLLVVLDLFTNILLYDHGLLDTDPLNVMSYLLCVMNLGITPTTQHRLISQGFMQRHIYFAKSWHCAFIFMTRMQFIVIPCADTNNKHYYFSYYLIRSRCIQSFIILSCITTMSLVDYLSDWHFDCVVCTNQEGRNSLYESEGRVSAAPLSFLISAYVAALLSYISFSRFNVLYMKSGMILDRNPWILFINFNFFDAIRAFKERKAAGAFRLEETLKKLINENARLPTLDSHTTRKDVFDTYEQLPFLIRELNEMHNVSLLYELLEHAILKLHDNFLSFFLNAFIIESIARYDPLAYKHPQSGLNLLDTAVQRKNNLIIRIVYLNCPLLLANNGYASFIELWNEKYVVTIDCMIQNDPSLFNVKTPMHDNDPNTMKSIFFHCVDCQYRTMIAMFARRLTAQQFADLYYYEYNAFMYAIAQNAIWALDILKDKVDWNVMTTRYMDFDTYGDNQMRLAWKEVLIYQLHPIAFAVVNDDHNTLRYLLSTDQGKSLIDAPFYCGVQELPADKKTALTYSEDDFLTPLMLAAMRGKPFLLKILSKAGADRTIQSKFMKDAASTAFDFWPNDLSKMPDVIQSAREEAARTREIIKQMNLDEAFVIAIENVVEYGIGNSSLTDEDNRIMDQYAEKYKLSREDVAALGTKEREFASLKKAIAEVRANIGSEENKLPELLKTQQKLQKEYNITARALTKVLLQNGMVQADYDAYIALQSAQTHDDDEKLEEEVKAISTENPTDFYVKMLIQNDSSNALKVLVQKMNAQGKFDPYLMELKGGNTAWENSFVGLCIRYNSLKLLKDMLQAIDKTKLRRITGLAAKYGSPYFGATSVEICQVLLEMGFKVETKSYDLKKGLLYHHSMRQNYNILKWLCENGSRFVHPKKQKKRYDNLLMEACANGCYQTLPVLIQLYDMDPKAMFVAIESCNITTIRMLLQNGLNDVDSIRDDEQRTALHMACCHATIEGKTGKLLHHLLFNLDWNLKVVDDKGNTPLHFAASADDKADRLKLVFKKLHQYPDRGVNIVNRRNNNGLTALQIAIQQGIAQNIAVFVLTNKCNLEGVLQYCLDLMERNDYESTQMNLFDTLIKYGVRFDADVEEEMIVNMDRAKKRYLSELKAIRRKHAEEVSNFIISDILQPLLVPMIASVASIPAPLPVLESFKALPIAPLPGSLPGAAHERAFLPLASYSQSTYQTFEEYEDRTAQKYNKVKTKAQSISELVLKYESFEREEVIFDTCETFNIWKSKDDDEEHKYDMELENIEMIEFNADMELIRDYRNVAMEQFNGNDTRTNDIIQIDIELGANKDKQILDLCLTMIDNNDSSEFAESYFNYVVMHYMFDTDSDWQILNNICAASQYEPILLKAYAHPRFKSNINAIICTHQNRKNAQLIVESLTFSYGNRYSDSKDKNKAQMDEKDAVRECIEFIMRQTIYEKLEVIKAKTLKQKLRNYIQMADTSQKKVGNVHYDSVEKKAVTVDSAPNTSSGELVA
eukprot:637395_1